MNDNANSNIFINPISDNGCIKQGLSRESVERNRKLYGSNSFTQKKSESLFVKFIKGLKEPMILILLFAFAIQFLLLIFNKGTIYETLGVLFAIIIADGISSISEKKQESKARMLKRMAELNDHAKVVRDGQLVEVNISDIVVDDIVFVQQGDKIPADGYLIKGDIEVNQAVLNGESEEAVKTHVESAVSVNIKDLLNSHYVYRGTTITKSEAYIKICKVGDNTLFGQIASSIQDKKRQTPLQLKLQKLAGQISKLGYIGALLIFTLIILSEVMNFRNFTTPSEYLTLILHSISSAVALIVCAVPEGLPMLTSILLSLQSLKMAKDNVMVRKINGLETAGSISLLFTDKTGTLTTGVLNVECIKSIESEECFNINDYNSYKKDMLINCLYLNNGANYSQNEVIGGNGTDRALLSYLAKHIDVTGIQRLKDNIVSYRPFNSSDKFSAVTIRSNHIINNANLTNGNIDNITFVKGAGEKVFDYCKYYINEANEIKEISQLQRQQMFEYMNEQSARAMRIIVLAFENGNIIATDIDNLESLGNLVFLAVVSIRDKIREEVKIAMREVENAGIRVVMITGDRKETAVAIARETGLYEDGDVALTSDELSKMSDEEVIKILPKLSVVARSLPSDKLRLVKISQSVGHTVAMTGDGVNDSPALKKADVGFAMGSGSEVAKEAGDIIILDDNFKSIGKAVLYGRTMFKNIRKFLIFQLTVNFAAVFVNFLSLLIFQVQAMNIMQLLFVNLIMDSFAAIAFGSEQCRDRYMNEMPISRSESIVTKGMLKTIIASSLYITAISLCLLCIKYKFNNQDMTYSTSVLFTFFMFSIIFNSFNSRTESLKLFESINKNRYFIPIISFLFLVQFALSYFGNMFFGVTKISINDLLVCVLLAMLIIPFGSLSKVFFAKHKL